jgi:hypothetical protein
VAVEEGVGSGADGRREPRGTPGAGVEEVEGAETSSRVPVGRRVGPYDGRAVVHYTEIRLQLAENDLSLTPRDPLFVLERQKFFLILKLAAGSGSSAMSTTAVVAQKHVDRAVLSRMTLTVTFATGKRPLTPFKGMTELQTGFAKHGSVLIFINLRVCLFTRDRNKLRNIRSCEGKKDRGSTRIPRLNPGGHNSICNWKSTKKILLVCIKISKAVIKNVDKTAVSDT